MRVKARSRTTAAVIDTDHDDDTGNPEPSRSVASGRIGAAVIDTAGHSATVNVARASGVPSARTTRTREGV